MEWLKKLIEGAKKDKDGNIEVEALMTSINAEFPKNAIPKATFNDVSEQLKTANTTISNLKKNNTDNETLQKTIKDHEATIVTQKTDYESKIKNLTLDTAINSLLTTNKAKHSDLLASKFDREKLVINADGTVTGLDEQFKGIKDTYKDLFEQTLGGNPPANPEGGSGGATGVTKEQFNKMGYKEKVNLYNTNKEVYDQLKGQE